MNGFKVGQSEIVLENLAGKRMNNFPRFQNLQRHTLNRSIKILQNESVQQQFFFIEF